MVEIIEIKIEVAARASPDEKFNLFAIVAPIPENKESKILNSAFRIFPVNVSHSAH